MRLWPLVHPEVQLLTEAMVTGSPRDTAIDRGYVATGSPRDTAIGPMATGSPRDTAIDRGYVATYGSLRDWVSAAPVTTKHGYAKHVLGLTCIQILSTRLSFWLLH